MWSLLSTAGLQEGFRPKPTLQEVTWCVRGLLTRSHPQSSGKKLIILCCTEAVFTPLVVASAPVR